MGNQTEVQRVVLEPDGQWTVGAGPSSALYVMVTADGTAAKVGACEPCDRAEGRLREVERKQRTRVEALATYPIRLAIVAELRGLAVDGDEMWSITTHLEGAVRFVLARRLGRLAAWPDWIHVDQPLTAASWHSEFLAAWAEVARLGRDASMRLRKEVPSRQPDGQGDPHEVMELETFIEACRIEPGTMQAKSHRSAVAKERRTSCRQNAQQLHSVHSGREKPMVKPTRRAWAVPCLVLASLLMASCGDGLGGEIEAVKRDASSAQAERVSVEEQVAEVAGGLEDLQERIAETQTKIEAAKAAIAQVNRANTVLATQEALRSAPSTTEPPPPPPTTAAPPDVSGRAAFACSHFRNVIGDAYKGIFTDAELRAKLGEVYNDGKEADEPEIVQASTNLYAAATFGDPTFFFAAEQQMEAACDLYEL